MHLEPNTLFLTNSPEALSLHWTLSNPLYGVTNVVAQPSSLLLLLVGGGAGVDLIAMVLIWLLFAGLLGGSLDRAFTGVANNGDAVPRALNRLSLRPDGVWGATTAAAIATAEGELDLCPGEEGMVRDFRWDIEGDPDTDVRLPVRLERRSARLAFSGDAGGAVSAVLKGSKSMTPEGEEEEEAEPVDDVEVVVNCVEIDAWFAHSPPDPEYRRGGLEEDDFDFSPPGRVSGGFIVSR
jgi:hypothetical protein